MIQWVCLRHWVVTFQSAAAGGQDVDKEWKKQYAHTAAGHRLVGPIREVNTDDNTLEILDDERGRDGGPPLTLQHPLPDDLLIVRINITLRANGVAKVAAKQLFGFVLECGTKVLYRAMAICFRELKGTYVVKGRPCEASATAIEVTSENQDELVKVAKDMLQHFATILVEEEVTTRKQTEEDEAAAWLALVRFLLHGWEQQLGWVYDEDTFAGWIHLANQTNAPRPLTIFFVEGPTDVRFTKAAMDLLGYDREHLNIISTSHCTMTGRGTVTPGATLLREGLLASGVSSEQLSAVDFVMLEDCDLRLLSVGTQQPATYSHRWRFGRALENYLIPSLAPLALLECKPGKAFELSVQAICKISTLLFTEKKPAKKGVDAGPSAVNTLATRFSSAGDVFASQLVSWIPQELVPADLTEQCSCFLSLADVSVFLRFEEERLAVADFERKLGSRFLSRDSPAALYHFKQQLHRFLCLLEEDVQDPGVVEELALSIIASLTEGATPPVLQTSNPAEPDPPLQELLGKAAKILSKQTHAIGSEPHTALCRVLFQAQEAYIDLMSNPSTEGHENMSQELFLCGHQTEGGGECGCQQLLLVGVDLEKATEGSCSCCGHQAAEHNKRFTIPNAATDNIENFYAALCMSAGLLWDSQDYLKEVRGEQRLGSELRGVHYKEHLWWLAVSSSNEEGVRKKEVMLLQKHYSGLPANDDLASGPQHAVALGKLCLLRQRQRVDLHSLFARLHVDQSAASKMKTSGPDEVFPRCDT